ncbi:LAMI_0D07206g1_1 [Lachancea mirantina]|uniref:LAMI_0D07206g1_1 n=1 Tax=Lachancea mirantina TaxID=1230905 RepID=A0A1G4JCA1_9SACH|nr:LAMI_0D07206g1_1 [Lachancea mirantina]
MSSLESVLKRVNESLNSVSTSLAHLRDQYTSNVDGDSDTKAKVMDKVIGGKDAEKVSLLSLKNGSMLAYINSLMMVIGEKLEQKDATAQNGRQRSIEHRVTLERGVKPLEKKLAYQLDKLVQAYSRMENEYVAAEKRAAERTHVSVADDDDSSEEEDESLFRPNAAAVATYDTGSQGRFVADAVDQNRDADANADEISGTSRYKPPKISAVLPPQHHFEDKFNARDHKDRSGRSRMQAMEDYINEMSEQPEWEASVGANIVNHGRGGVKSQRDARKDQRVKDYEEDNFTRLNAVGNKQERRRAKQRERAAQENMIGGEDFGIFNSKRRIDDSTTRRASKKPKSAWDRAKKNL